MTDGEINSGNRSSNQDQLNSFQRVLVVDDDFCTREIISITLTGCGYKVDTAKDGVDAWKALNDVSYQLLITDHKMPKVTGLELIIKLRSKDSMMPVILVSRTMPTEDLKRYPWLKVDGLLCKPFTTTELVDVVKKVAGMIETSFAVPIRQPGKLEIEFKASPTSSFKKPIASPGQTSWTPHILLVDDDCEIRQLAVELLTDSGYNVEQAKDGAAGWLAIQSNTYDLIITDNQMSRMTGIEMIEKMRAARIATPIIMATGNLPRHGFVQKPWLEPNAMLQRPFSSEDFLEAVKRVLEQDNGKDGHDRTHTPNNLDKVVAISTEATDISGIIGMKTNDPSENVNSTETHTISPLPVSELRYRRLFEAARDGILILDVESGRITDVNPFLIGLLGFARVEMIGKTVGELSPFKDIEPNKVMLKRLQQDGYVRYDDLPLETRDGRRIAVEVVSNVYQEGDKKVIQCNIRDITMRKQAQDEVRRLNTELEQRVVDRTAELQVVNEELESFSYSVSHDLRAPLRHIKVFVEQLQHSVGSSFPKHDLACLTKIHRSTVRMGDLIDDLLAFSHTGRVELVKSDVILDALVRDALGDFQAETKARNIVWKIHPLPIMHADSALLRMVLVNLMSNAVKFTGNCDEAKIEIGQSASNDGETVIYIRDNGAGFDPDYANKLFGTFQRLHSFDEFEGTGIGLANVQRIILRHGGQVWAKGIVNEGATFSFSLPKKQKNIQKWITSY